MQEYSRIKLYESLKNSYNDLFKLNQNINLLQIIEFNLNILENIEGEFLSDDKSGNMETISDFNILKVLKSNIEWVKKENFYKNNELEIKTIVKIENLIKNANDRSSMNSNEIFCSLLEILGDYNNNITNIELKDRRDLNKTIVFLSYAYKDRLYVLSLYCKFFYEGIYLYIDFLHNGKQTDGMLLKKILNQEINNSSQLLFLRSPYSELKIEKKDKKMIRPWCQWELGTFCGCNDDQEIYYINLYSIDLYNNIHLHGLRLLKEVYLKRLQSNQICTESGIIEINITNEALFSPKGYLHVLCSIIKDVGYYMKKIEDVSFYIKLHINQICNMLTNILERKILFIFENKHGFLILYDATRYETEDVRTFVIKNK